MVMATRDGYCVPVIVATPEEVIKYRKIRGVRIFSLFFIEASHTRSYRTELTSVFEIETLFIFIQSIFIDKNTYKDHQHPLRILFDVDPIEQP